MKKVFLIGLALFPLAASAVDLKGTCQDAAINRALLSAPDMKPSTPAKLTQIKLVSITQVDSSTSLERYFTITTNPRGTYTSVISVEYQITPTVADEVFRGACRFVGQQWEEGRIAAAARAMELLP